MAIESVAATTLIKEGAGAAALKAGEELALKMGQQLSENLRAADSQHELRAIEQLTQMNQFRLGENSSPELNNRNILKQRELNAGDELKEKFEADAALDNKQELIENKSKEYVEYFDMSDNTETDCNFYNSLEDRINQTPNKDCIWEGERGESKCIPLDSERKEILQKYDLDGIDYSAGFPDFSPVSEADAKIENMSSDRVSNFRQADCKCAEQWNGCEKDGRTDWTPREIAEYRKENNLTWHECEDRTTCQLIPSEINGKFSHLGGVSECKALEQAKAAKEFTNLHIENNHVYDNPFSGIDLFGLFDH